MERYDKLLYLEVSDLKLMMAYACSSYAHATWVSSVAERVEEERNCDPERSAVTWQWNSGQSRDPPPFQVPLRTLDIMPSELNKKGQGSN